MLNLIDGCMDIEGDFFLQRGFAIYLTESYIYDV